ncbi:LL-diaminopimelate aminotransferase, partial [Raphidocelis subcapitata]
MQALSSARGAARAPAAPARPQRGSLSVRAATTTPEKTGATTRVARNANFGKLQAGYLFPEIARRRRAHQEKHPDAQIISLGIGDTTEPLPPFIANAMAKAAAGLATREGYSGYGAEQGQGPIREAIASTFYPGLVAADEVFVSDGSKCDISRLQVMFGTDKSIAVQDPSYPVYVDTTVMMGNTGGHDGTGFEGIAYMVCTPENSFFPDLDKVPRTDIIFFCSPNNPTGAAATRDQLTRLVAFAKRNGSILVYDAAYALYITNPDCPKTIYEIEGADEVAIETCSFSKYAGFTGVRLGWTVVPKKLRYSDGSTVHADWNRVMTTCFNGASNIVQAGGLACLQ